MLKEIVYDRETRDYRMHLDGTLIGFARTYHEAEITLDQTAYEMLIHGDFASALDLDGGSDDDPPADAPGDDCPSHGPYADDDCPKCGTPLLTDVLNVITMALGHTYGAQSVVNELRRVKARLEAAALLSVYA